MRDLAKVVSKLVLLAGILAALGILWLALAGETTAPMAVLLAVTTLGSAAVTACILSLLAAIDEKLERIAPPAETTLPQTADPRATGPAFADAESIRRFNESMRG